MPFKKFLVSWHITLFQRWFGNCYKSSFYKDLANSLYIIIVQDVSGCKVLGSVTFEEKYHLECHLGVSLMSFGGTGRIVAENPILV